MINIYVMHTLKDKLCSLVHGGLQGTNRTRHCMRLTFRRTRERLGNVNVVNNIGLDSISASLNLHTNKGMRHSSLNKQGATKLLHDGERIKRSRTLQMRNAELASPRPSSIPWRSAWASYSGRTHPLRSLRRYSAWLMLPASSALEIC